MNASSPSVMPALRTSSVRLFFLSERAWKEISSPESAVVFFSTAAVVVVVAVDTGVGAADGLVGVGVVEVTDGELVVFVVVAGY